MDVKAGATVRIVANWGEMHDVGSEVTMVAFKPANVVPTSGNWPNAVDVLLSWIVHGPWGSGITNCDLVSIMFQDTATLIVRPGHRIASIYFFFDLYALDAHIGLPIFFSYWTAVSGQ
jgi:hypothetical protein